MSLILCIETGTDICSVGIAKDGELLSLRESDEGRDHARKVGEFVEVAPSARGLARLAQQALDEGRTEDIAYFEPFYLKDFVVTTSKKSLF